MREHPSCVQVSRTRASTKSSARYQDLGFFQVTRITIRIVFKIIGIVTKIVIRTVIEITIGNVIKFDIRIVILKISIIITGPMMTFPRGGTDRGSIEELAFTTLLPRPTVTKSSFISPSSYRHGKESHFHHSPP